MYHTQPLRPHTSQQVRNSPLFTPVLYLPSYRCSKCRPRRSSNSLIVPLGEHYPTARRLSSSTKTVQQHEGERTHGANRRPKQAPTSGAGRRFSRRPTPYTYRTSTSTSNTYQAASSTHTHTHTYICPSQDRTPNRKPTNRSANLQVHRV